MSTLSPRELAVRDPLSDVTRKERKTLLGLSVVGVVLVKSGVVPTKISTLGIDFNQTDQRTLLSLVGFVVLYFLGAFLVYAASDFLAWRLALVRSIRESFEKFTEASDQGREREVRERLRQVMSRNRYAYFLAGPVSILRGIFEFLLPVVVGVYALVVLWSVDANNVKQSEEAQNLEVGRLIEVLPLGEEINAPQRVRVFHHLTPNQAAKPGGCAAG